MPARRCGGAVRRLRAGRARFDDAFSKGPGEAAEVAVHEAGHAISTEKQRSAALDVNLSVGDAAANARAHAALRATMSGTDTKRAADLKAFADRNGIAPIAPYAAAQGTAEEFYAEAYAMWVTDPAKLQQLAPALRKYFDEGKHRG